MTPRKKQPKKPERRFVVWSQRRPSPDIRKLGRALLAVALAEQQRADHAPAAEEGTADAS